jgi:hypothetical protein
VAIVIPSRRLDGRGKPATELVGADALTGHTVAAIVKRQCQRIGLDPVEFSGHSLRSGYLTSAVEANAPIMKIAEQTRHRSLGRWLPEPASKRREIFDGLKRRPV